MTTDEMNTPADGEGVVRADTKNEDFKYVLQDVSSLYFGRELTYAEMLDREDVPFKFKAIVNGCIQKDAGLDKTLAEHLLDITQEQFSYRVYEQLKLSVKICCKKEKGGRKKDKWVHKGCTIRQFCETYQARAAAGDVRIEEVSISKLALMVTSV